MPVCAQISLNTKDTYIEFDKKGYYKSIKVDGEEILLDNFYPVISVMSNDQLLAPVNLKQKGNMLDFMMPDKKIVTVRCEETPTCIVLKIVKVPEIYDALYFGPFGVSINDIVGDVVGVAQGRGLAFGVQALNIKPMQESLKNILKRFLPHLNMMVNRLNFLWKNASLEAGCGYIGARSNVPVYRSQA